jgi:hypothetical protein
MAIGEQRRNRVRLAVGGLILVVALLGGVGTWVALHRSAGPQLTAFPTVETATLTPTQQRILTIARQEFEHPRPGTFYAQGTEEPWCADFASWVMREVGVPYRNPHSGGWRIPGTKTLQAYYQAQHRFRSPDSGYSPAIGDVILYDDPSPFGSHVNLVVSASPLITLGGNEQGQIRLRQHTEAERVGIVGYGTLGE